MNLVFINGDGASLEDEKPFINWLSSKGYSIQFIPLKESGPQVDYEELESDNYCAYIDSMLPKQFYQFTMLGISKGCHWCRVYASRNKSRVSKLVLIEPTTMTPELMQQFELDRGNYFISNYYNDPSELTREDNTHTALDVIVSDHKAYIAKCPVVILWTSKNNQNQAYDSHVLALKKKFERYLINHSVHLKVIHVDASHYLTTQPKHFSTILKALKL